MAKSRSQPSISRGQVSPSNLNLDFRIIQRSAAATGIGLQYVMKEARVFDVWNRLIPIVLSRRVAKNARIVCKGGTALNKIFLGKLQRFSEDLDFDAFFNSSVSDRSQKISFLQENVISAIGDGYAIDQPRIMRQVLRFTCSFTNEMGRRDSLFVEFNIETPLVGKIVKARARSFILRLPVVSTPVYSFHSLVAKKLKTFYEREAGKDLYDIYRSLEKCKPRDMEQIISMLKKILKAEGIEYDDFVSRVDTTLSDINRLWKLHASSNPYIPRPLRLDWAKAGLEVREKLMKRL